MQFRQSKINDNLTKEGRNISENAELYSIFNNCFPEIISNLKMPSLINNSAIDSNAISNPLSIATKIFDQHPVLSDLV